MPPKEKTTEKQIEIISQLLGGLDIGGESSLLSLIKQSDKIDDFTSDPSENDEEYSGVYKCHLKEGRFIGDKESITVKIKQPKESGSKNSDVRLVIGTEGNKEKAITFQWKNDQGKESLSFSFRSRPPGPAGMSFMSMELKTGKVNYGTLKGQNKDATFDELPLGLHDEKTGLKLFDFEKLENHFAFKFSNFTGLSKTNPIEVHLPLKLDVKHLK